MILQVTDSVDRIKNFGPDWYKNNLEEQFKTMVRQAVRKRGMNETAISTTALDLIDAEIHDQLTLFLTQKKIPVQLVTMTVGKTRSARRHQEPTHRDGGARAARQHRETAQAGRRPAYDGRAEPGQCRQRLPRVDASFSRTIHLGRKHQDAAGRLRRTGQGELHLHPEWRRAGLQSREVMGFLKRNPKL